MLIEQWGFKVSVALSVVKLVEAQIIIKLVQSFKIDDNISAVLFVSYKRRKKGLRENYKFPFQGLSFLISLSVPIRPVRYFTTQLCKIESRVY